MVVEVTGLGVTVMVFVADAAGLVTVVCEDVEVIVFVVVVVTKSVSVVYEVALSIWPGSACAPYIFS